jgi:hypothetical protein
MKALPDFKRGDTFALACTYKIDGAPASITGLAIASQIRTVAGDLVAALTVTASDQVATPGQFTLSAASTTAWPIAGLRCDIQITDGAVIISSDTFLVPVVQDITQ